MEYPLISVIVPIYKVEQYLEECIRSILNQTYQNLEILLIDDGSPDRSATICQEYVEQDNRVRYLRKENGGLADARNYGIERSKGEFLIFVDSDDWLTNDCVERLICAAQKYQKNIVVSSYSRYREEDSTFHYHIFDENYYEKIYKRKELIEQLPNLEVYDLSFQTSWGILWHNSLFHITRFPKGRVNEDIGTNYKLYLQVEEILYINKPLYWYRERKNSITTCGMSEKKMQDDLEQRLERISLLALKGYDITQYIQQQKHYFVSWYEEACVSHIEQTEIARRFYEDLQLLNHN